MKRSMVLMVLFVLGVLIATSSAAFDSQQEKSVIVSDSQTQVQDMKCGKSGCGEEKKQCDKAAKCETKKECSEAKKAECAKKKQCCQKEAACDKKK